MDKFISKIKNKKIIVVLILVGLIGLVGGTLAYLTSSSVFTNRFTTGTYSTSIVEEFESPDNWTPGTTTNKKVNVTNTGSVEVAVRAKYEEKWIAADGTTELSNKRNGEAIAQFEIGEDWIEATDGYYYYNDTLIPNETSTDFISSVTFNPNFELEEGIDIECVTTSENGVTNKTCTNLSTGYSGAKYTLTITIETIQADQIWDYVLPDTLYRTIAGQAVSDSITSEYVTSSTGINFQAISSDTNGKGVYTIASTLNDAYPIHYFRGSVDNNHVIFGGYCWEIIRTTETGGVKMIYDGVPDVNGACNNTGTSSQIGTSKYISSDDSLSNVGYMYNTVYNYKANDYMRTSSVLVSNPSVSNTNYYYGDSITYDTTTKKYTLENATQMLWSSNYSTLTGYYTCQSSTATSCSMVYYIVQANSTTAYHLFMYDGETKDDYMMTMSATITDNGDGTYTLDNPITIPEPEWYTSYDNYKNYYLCSDRKSTTCSNIYYIVGTTSTYYNYINAANHYVYGNSFTYDETTGTYTLTDTKQFWDWSINYKTELNDSHYTCFNSTGTCKSIKYMYYVDNLTAYYINLTGGKSVEDALNEMLYAEDVNNTDSTMKTYVDQWYSENMTNYTKYLENTVFCNDRSIYEINGWNPDGGSVRSYLSFGAHGRKVTGTPTVDCANTLDAFTLSVENGGTEGYGNNKLTYPVGLITSDEMMYAGGINGTANKKYYLYTGQNYWTFAPASYHHMYARNFYLSSSGYLTAASNSNNYGVRPVISLRAGIKYSSGNGTSETPYVIE